MKASRILVIAALAASVVLNGGLIRLAHAEGHEDDVIGEVMKKYHKAPKGEDPICKKALDGKASASDLKNLVEGYSKMCTAKPPKGDEKSWKEKTGKLLAAAKDLQAGKAGAADHYKEAVNCKACHTAHKAD